jgi:hypothetical protein
MRIMVFTSSQVGVEASRLPGNRQVPVHVAQTKVARDVKRPALSSHTRDQPDLAGPGSMGSTIRANAT